MATIVKQITNGENLYPSLRTRDQARNMARTMREQGITPTTPRRVSDGWNVSVKHVGGTLSIKKH